jgi:hypothetical protein
MLIGFGVGACLMAPLTSYRRHFSAGLQLRANSWMLMTGSLGMLASTLPVQWLLPSLGWRGLFWGLALALALAMALIAALVPRDEVAAPGVLSSVPGVALPADSPPGYREIVRHPLFLRLAPLGFFLYGGLIAVQSLWAGPWLTRVGGATPAEAASGLFLINLCMLVAFMAWGALMPLLARRGLDALRLMAWGLPLALAALVWNVALGPAAGAGHWALWCVGCTFVSLSQPAVGQAFPAAQAGRALSAFNLVIFSGVFCLQWGLGVGIDALHAAGLPTPRAFQAVFAAFAACCVGAYLWFVWPRRVFIIAHP